MTIFKNGLLECADDDVVDDSEEIATSANSSKGFVSKATTDLRCTKGVDVSVTVGSVTVFIDFGVGFVESSLIICFS